MSSLICFPAKEAGSIVVWQCAAVGNIESNEVSKGARTNKSRPFRNHERDQELFLPA
jgi:hypothetical protein